MGDRMRENRAKAIAAMGLVGRDGDGFNVTSPGFAKETFRVWKDEARKVRCCCEEFTERVTSQPDFRCEHILAVKFHLLKPQQQQQQAATPDKGLRGSEHVARTMAELVSPKQLAAIRINANSQGVDAEALCEEWLGCKPEELNKRAASAFLDRLKSRQ